jgi:signal transduction histidine kinase
MSRSASTLGSSASLDALVRLVEQQSRGMRCSILVSDGAAHLRHGAAPSLPDAYNRAVDGLPIGEGVGSCGTAAHRGEQVVVTDTFTDPLWSDYRDLAREHGLRACWSTPIIGAQAEVLGTFALYYHEPRTPAPEELALIETATRIAAATIERERAEAVRERLLRELERARASAEEANQATSVVLASLSHERRTPIHAVVGYTELLEMGIAGPLTEGQRSSLDRIRSSSQHLLGLVDEVLDLAKVEAGQMRIDRDRVAVAKTLREALDLVEPEASRRGVEIHGEPSDAEGPRYDGDPDRVRQILVNLLSNAVKFTAPGGGVSVSSALAGRPDPQAQLPGEGPWLRVDVEDTGVGIPGERIRQIFEPFFQVEGGYTRESGGTGLGLTISRRLARSMGGDLTVRSRLGEGARFTLWLPAGMPRTAGERDDRRAWPRALHEVPRLAEVGRTLARCSEDVVQELVDRIRADRIAPASDEMDRAQLEDHTATFLVDIGLSMVALDEGGGEPALMHDGTEIQRLIAERHGAQRARLGWSEESLEKEFQILREVVESTLRRNVPVEAEGSLEEAAGLLGRLLEQAERVSLRGFRRAVERAAPDVAED